MTTVTWTTKLNNYKFFQQYVDLSPELVKASATKITYAFFNDAQMVVTGTGLGTDRYGDATKGTLDSVTFYDRSGAKLITFDDINMSFKTVWAETAKSGWRGFEALVLKGNDTIIGSSANDQLYGLTGNDNMKGNAGNDKMYGWLGNDTMDGGKGNDFMDGGKGNDTMKGGDGNDTLIGFEGLDKLTGGAGADQFVFTNLVDSTAAASGRDVITDFSRAQKDKIVLTEIDANVNKAGDQAFTLIAGEFTKKAGQLRIETKKSDTFIYGDVNGDGKADFGIELDNTVLAMKASDFLL